MSVARRKSTPTTPNRSDIEAAAFPTREYIGAMALEMALEMARMAREEGDGRLATMLEQVAQVAGAPPA